eukprot:TRINITY_DN27670_c0_g1_i1.p2 TRINITY_DN27670_c0_g1~~TRINITY_DN27670_c0_g1_i1.p2  ORF type:complete len:147 (-),score=17.91 TRINITY_DN27670_c0_g1_i1:80-520(-)
MAYQAPQQQYQGAPPQQYQGAPPQTYVYQQQPGQPGQPIYYTNTTTTTTENIPYQPQYQGAGPTTHLVIQETYNNSEATTAWLLLLGGWLGAFFCWIPGAWIGLRSRNPNARLPGILNAVMAGLSIVGTIVLIVWFVVFVNRYSHV